MTFRREAGNGWKEESRSPWRRKQKVQGEKQEMNFRRVAGKNFRKQVQETNMLEEQEMQQKRG